MAITEACQVWIEQRIKEELEVPESNRKSYKAIAKLIASEILKYFEATVNPETIRSRIRNIAMVNSPPQATTESDKEIPVESKPTEEIKADRKHIATGKKKGGKRSGAGKKSVSKVNKYEKAMIKAHASFRDQIAIAKRNSWKYVSIEKIKEMLENIASLIEA